MALYLSLLVLGAMDLLEGGNPYHLPLLAVLCYFYEPSLWPVATLLYLFQPLSPQSRQPPVELL